MNIGANIDERFGRVADGISELLKFEDAVVDVVAIVHRNITVDGLGPPNFGRYFDNKSTRARLGKRQRRSIIIVGVGVGIVADICTGQERRKSDVAIIGIGIGVIGERNRGSIKEWRRKISRGGNGRKKSNRGRREKGRSRRHNREGRKRGKNNDRGKLS
jgi:hypothetical protein